MRIVRLDHVTDEMILARPIYGSDGQVLLVAGTRVARYLDRLKRWGVGLVYVSSGEDGDELEVDDVVREETRLRSLQTVRSVFEEVETSGKVETEAVGTAVRNIIAEVFRNGTHQVQLVEIRAMNDYTFAHSVAVCVLSVLIGTHLGMSPSRLEVLGVGALLHDLGKAKIPPQVWSKTGKLTAEERALIKSHPTEGYRVLKSNPGISLVTAHIAYQHHERLDGSGYPRGLKGDEIHEMAKIVAVADVYDALTTDRAYRPRVYPYHALSYLLAHAGSQFDKAAVRALGRSVAPFPIGSPVMLSNGEAGFVVQNRPESPFRPAVKVRRRDGSEVRRDLSADPALLITHVFASLE